MKAKAARSLVVTVIILTWRCGPDSPSTFDPVGPVTRVDVRAQGVPYVGIVLPLRATAIRANSVTHDVTNLAEWSSSAPEVARAEQGGQVIILTSGTAEIRATFNGVTGATALDAVVPPTVAGRVVDRLNGMPISASSIVFNGGPAERRADVIDGEFAVALPPGEYDVTIEGGSHVTHRSQQVLIDANVPLRFSVIRWGSGAFGAVYDERFHRYFHQIARVSENNELGLRKWTVPPTELYLVEGKLELEHFAKIRTLIEEINIESLRAMWCGFAGPLQVRTGLDETLPPGRIRITPYWDAGGTATIGSGPILSGSMIISAFDRTRNEIFPRERLKAVLMHEFFHVAFAFHVCGGSLGQNPFGFSATNCPDPDSVMANRGDLVLALSPQDRLAACLVYHPDTHPRNQWPDTNPPVR